MNTIQRLLYESMRAHADRRAIVDSGSRNSLTYSELYDRASSVAGYLRSQGMDTGDYAVIALTKSVPYIIVEAACFLFGFGAVPMDAGYPEDRIAYTAENVGAKIIIRPTMLEEILSWPQKAEYREVPEDTPAVVVYTSGSTGKPKGILHDQESLYNSVTRRQTILKPEPDDIAGLVPPFTFIAGVITTMNPLTCGACVTPIPREVIMNPRELALFIDRMGITWTYLSPKVLKVFREAGQTLRMVTTGSERVSGIAPRRYPIMNTYGMSETASAVAGFLIDKAYDSTPLGHALDGVSIYILDEHCNKVNEGEICVAGHLLSRYIGLPELTAERIIPNPFRAEDGHERLLRTGDLGRWDEEGRLVYINRMDWMVKINGQRVEPGEIEAVIKSVHGVTDAAVKGFTKGNGQTYLCAYYVAAAEVKEDFLRAAVSRKLPFYMMPAHFIPLDAMPVNANGKLDRLSLKEPEEEQFASEYAAPTNPTEERLCRVMAGVLGVDRVGIHDDFFRIGGDSISCMSLIAQLNEPRISVRLLYKHRTPAAIAQALKDAQAITEADNEDEENRLALKQDQPLTPYQLYYLDYQLYSPELIVTNLPYLCSFPREAVDPQALKKAVDHVTHHFAAFGTVFMFNDAVELIQRYCPDRIPEIGITETTEAQFTEEKKAFIRPFRMMNELLWRAHIFVTESYVRLLLDFDHAIADGTTIRRVFWLIFEALNGRKLYKDQYYLFLRRLALHAKTPEAQAEHELVRKLYDGQWSRYPQPDYDSRGNSNLTYAVPTKHTLRECQAAAEASSISLGDALVTAGMMALSRFNGNPRVSVEWIFNGRDEQWKKDLVGLTLCGIPAVMDFDRCKDRESILAEARKQNELGLQYAEYSFALENMSPGQIESMKIVYEHGLDLPDNMPAGTTLEWDGGYYSGMLCLFQFLINEGTADEPLTLVAVCQGSRYSEESAQRMTALFSDALEELLFP